MPSRPIMSMVLYTTVNSQPVPRLVASRPNTLGGSMIANANSGKSGCTACGH